MLGVSGSSGDGAAEGAETHESGGAAEVVGAVQGGGVEESGGGGVSGNRWPRQETLALLKIRSEMDVAFKDASLKGPLWEEVSRKMEELGFRRSAKKCKEKFENVYKYHKRTKDGRGSKQEGKTYRFFDQLEALENTPPNHYFSHAPPPPPTTTTAVATNISPPPMPSHVTVSSTSSPTPLTIVAPPKIVTNNIPINSSSFQIHQPAPLIQQPPQTHTFHPVLSNSTSSSSSTSSDEDIQMRRGKKRKWKDYFERLIKDVIQKQEELQKKFLETLEKRERDRIAREEAWRLQETARLNREHDLFVQERSIAAAKDSAVIAFLHKVTGQHNLQIPVSKATENPQQPPPPAPQPQQSTISPPTEQAIVTATPTKIIAETSNRDNVSVSDGASSSRWPKAEVEALIKLRTNLELKYQENVPKGPLWEEISKAMSLLGYNRNAKRCKEKWENINKYFKKVKESNKKRTPDSKTCPYFHQLDAIYKDRAKFGYPMKLDQNPMPVPIMARPEQQWPDPDHDNNVDGHENNNHEDDDEDDEDEVGEYEIIINKQQQQQPSSLTKLNTVE